MRSRGLAFKFVLFILTGSTLVFLAAFSYYYLSSKASVMWYVQENLRNLAHSTVHEIETVLRGVEKVPRNTAALLSSGQYGAEEISRFAHCMVSENPELFGAAIAFEPNAFDSKSVYFAPYCYREADGRVTSTELGAGGTYHYFTMDWYQIPKELNRPAWTEPYFDEGGGNIMMATFSVPFTQKVYDMDAFQGVVTADVSLAWLRDIVSAIKVARTGYAFLISQNGMFVTHPISGVVMRQSLFSLAEAKGDRLLRELGRQMIRGGEGMVVLNAGVLSGSKSWLYYAPLKSVGWSLGIVVPEDELLAEVHRLGRQVILIGLGGFVLLCLLVMLVTQRITRPLRSLARATDEIARGNLDAQLPAIASKDEIGSLTTAFGRMTVALKEYIADLTETTAAKERYEGELKIARSIQMSFLPKEFPPFPGRDNLDIYARLEPAREIGGDLYDFFFLDDDHLFFIVGDVSDKGIPAALFMAVTKTLLKGIAESGMEPSEILNRTNVELCRDNDSLMFVTVFCGVLNLKTGALVYSNAGHEPPILVRKGGAPERLEIPPGFVLGAMEDSTYRSMQTTLGDGDMLLVFTDGVTEAMSISRQLYSAARLVEAVRACPGASAKALTASVFESVAQYASGAPQSDDITVLALSFSRA